MSGIPMVVAVSAADRVSYLSPTSIKASGLFSSSWAEMDRVEEAI